MAVKTYIAAITEALDLALEKDKDALIFGEDVGQNGGKKNLSFVCVIS